MISPGATQSAGGCRLDGQGLDRRHPGFCGCPGGIWPFLSRVPLAKAHTGFEAFTREDAREAGGSETPPLRLAGGRVGLFQFRIEAVGDEHVAGGVGDHEGGAAGLGDGLRGDAATPEHRDFAGADFHRLAQSGRSMSRMPMVSGSPAWTGAPWTLGSGR